MGKIIFSIIALLFLGGSIWLQIVLSKRPNKWAGLIIPFICLLISLLNVVSIPLFMEIKTTTTTQINSGEIIHQEVAQSLSEKLSIGRVLSTIIPVFIVSNLSTLFYWAIYLGFREKRRKNLELEKMSIQDLE